MDSLILVSLQDHPDLGDHQAAGIPVVTLHPVSADCPASSLTIDYGEAAQVARKPLTSPDRPRAVYCSTDEQAFGVLFAAHEAGLRVPEDLAVVGFDGARNCAVSIPALTTVKQPVAQIARCAMEILDGRRADDPRPGKPCASISRCALPAGRTTELLIGTHTSSSRPFRPVNDV